MSDERKGVAVLGVQPLVLTRGEGARLISAIAREFNWPVKIEGNNVILGVCWHDEAMRLVAHDGIQADPPPPDHRYGAGDAEFPLGCR